MRISNGGSQGTLTLLVGRPLRNTGLASLWGQQGTCVLIYSWENCIVAATVSSTEWYWLKDRYKDERN